MKLANYKNPLTINTILSKISLSWEKRSQAKKNNILTHKMFDPNKNDFVLEHLPFFNHPLFQESEAQMQSTILSAAWLAYNRTTVDIEIDIVNPICSEIIFEHIPGLKNQLSKDIASKTMIDESYHVQLTLQSSEITRICRGLSWLQLPRSGLVQSMWHYQNLYPETWQKTIIQLVTCIITEVFIGAQLAKIAKSTDKDLQPLNKLTTKIHFLDETTHGTIFNRIALEVYCHLNKREKKFFRKIFPEVVYWFVNGYTNSWDVILKQLKFKKRKELIQDCLKGEIKRRIDSFDYTPLNDIYQDLNFGSFEEQFRTLCHKKR